MLIALPLGELIAIDERYAAGDLSEDATRVLLGDEFDML